MLQCLVFAARLKGVDLSVSRLVHEYSLGDREPDLGLVARIAVDHGFKAKAVSLGKGELTKLGDAFPVLIRLNNGNGVLVHSVGDKEGKPHAAVIDPLADRAGLIIIDLDQLTANWDGAAVLLKRRYRLDDEDQPFGWRWFMPELLRQKRYFADVALAALILPVVGLASPIFFQLVIDKVLVHHSYATLYVLTVGIVGALLFEGVFSFIRQFVLLFATRRIDSRVARRTFGHLLSLPLAFFERRYAGVLVKHMQQTEKIRQFLTGRLFFTVLDSVSLFVFIPFLWFYSTKLTLVVLLFTGLIAGVIGVLIKPFRRRLKELYLAEGERQAFLVENIHGMSTVKSLAIEPAQRAKWDDKAADAVNRHYRVGIISSVAGNLTRILERMMIVAIIALGALDVFDSKMTVGALVAFQMLAGRVTGPLVQMVGLIHEYQETALSVKMLGEVMNAKPERDVSSLGVRPDFAGRITFEGVTFSYDGTNLPALAGVDLDIAAGQVLGVVGRSGSGKSTLAKLIQGLYTQQEGTVRIDSVEIRELDVAHLRRSIGVVLQENFLFRASVRDNISVTKSDAGFAQIVDAARMAGADEFIERLPQGYDTLLEEGAVNLSGGQKQRLAIARALLTSPRILILDEATSALDPESEAIIKRNLGRIARDRTVIIISHRLTNLVDADAIVVLDQGRIMGLGPHVELLSTCELYRHLWNQQTGSRKA